jgi:hypothetical protein
MTEDKEVAMSQCWSCYWGWPEPVARIYLEAVAALDGDTAPLDYGPGHVVWSDENFDLAEACLQECDTAAALGDDSPEQMAIVRQSLQALAALPRETWDVCPAAYDGEHPEQYPPPAGIAMVQVRGRRSP